MAKPYSRAWWIAKAKKALAGKKIVDVRWLSTKEAQSMGWCQTAVVLVLDDGTLLWPASDDEGNAAGALFGQGPQGQEQTWPRGV